MSGYIGPIPVPQGIQKKETFTATAGQTTFNTNGYTDGAFINVYLNGVRLINGTDYTATNGSDVVLTQAASVSDVLDFETFNSFSLASQQFENITTKNPTHEDTDGGRESALSFQGEQSGGEISTLAAIQASHDGTADDQKGDLIFKTNDGSDNNAPTEAMRITSQQRLGLGTDDPSDDFEIKPSADEKGITLKTTDSIRPYLNFDANRSGANQQVMRLQGKWNGNTITRFETSTGDDTSNKDNGYFTFQTATSSSDLNTRVRIDEHGIKFGSDTAEENGLHDYEEGTWTPVLTGMSVTSGSVNGSYRKIGGVVTCTMRMENVTLTGTHTGARVEGLPYNCGLRTSAGKPVTYNHQHGDKTLGALIEGGTSLVYLQYHGTGAWAEAPFSAGANRYFNVQLTYNTSS